MNWTVADTPTPDISNVWTDDLWPPKQWYDLADDAMGRVERHWEWDTPDTARDLASKMTQEQLWLWAVRNIVGQICNGGFSQALYNSYGELAEEAVLGLRHFEMSSFADLIDEAWTAYGLRPISRNRNERIARLEHLSDMDEGECPTEPIEHAFGIFKNTGEIWDDLETKFYAKLHAYTHGPGYNAAFFRPLAEWVLSHRDRFFILN